MLVVTSRLGLVHAVLRNFINDVNFVLRGMKLSAIQETNIEIFLFVVIFWL